MADDAVAKLGEILHTAAETHHVVFGIVHGADEDWASGARTPAALRSAALRGSIPVRISDIFAHSVEEGHVGSPGHAVPNRRMSSLA